MKPKYGKKKEEIMKCAKSVFLVYGYKKTTLDDIASKLGLRKNTLYYYFRDKEEIFNEVLKEDLEEILSGIKDVLSNCKTAEEKVYTYFTAFSHAYIKRSKLYTVDVKVLIEFMVVILKTHDKFFTKFDEILYDILKEGIKRGEFVKHDVRSLATLLLDINISFEFRHLTAIAFESNDGPYENYSSAMQVNMQKTIEYILKGIKTTIKSNDPKKNIRGKKRQ